MARLLPIWATTIIFWTTYAQMITFSVQQASTMERSIGSFQIPAGSLTVFFVAAILITLGVYDRIIMPLWKKWKGKQGKSRSIKIKYIHLQRILTLIMFLCHRLHKHSENGHRPCPVNTWNGSSSHSREEEASSGKSSGRRHSYSAYKCVPIDPTVLLGGCRGSLHIHRAA